MPKGFQFPVQNPAPQVWTALTDDAINTKDPMTAQRGADMLTLVGRLKPGVTIQQATADLSLIHKIYQRNPPTPTSRQPAPLLFPSWQMW